MMINTSINPKGSLNHWPGSDSLLYYFNAFLTATSTSVWSIIRNCIDLNNNQFSTSAFGYPSKQGSSLRECMMNGCFLMPG